MKLRTKLAIIVTVAMLAFAGVGFAAWTFTAERNLVSDISATKEVAVGIELNDNFKVYNASTDAEVTALYLICDAPSGKTGILDGDSVYWATDAAGANLISNIYVKGTLAKEMEDGVKDDVTTVTVSFAISHDFSSTYITFGNFATVADKNVTVSNNAEVKSANIALPTVAYIDATLPHSISELAAMRTALATELSGAAISCSIQITDAQ